MQIDCLTSDAAMVRLRPEWTELWRGLPGATPFQSPAWLLAWWRHFGNGRPRIVTARRDGALVGVLPLYELPEPGCRKLLPIGIGASDYLDALADPACLGIADALLGALIDIGGWDECHLPDLPPGAALAAARCPPGLCDESAPTVPCPVLALPGSTTELDRVVPRKTLRDVRQAAGRAAPIIERAEQDTLPAFLADLFRLHDKRWHARGESGVLAHPKVRAFHDSVAPVLDAEGLLRFYRLNVAGEAVAVYYGFHHRGRAYAYIGGFDPDRPRLSPGAQMLRHAIGEAIAEGGDEFHFLRGGETYKYAWGAIDRWNSTRTLRRR